MEEKRKLETKSAVIMAMRTIVHSVGSRKGYF